MDSTLIATIICSWGGIGDTSYATIEEIDSVIEGMFNNVLWNVLTKPQKTAAIISASRDIDISYPWVGYKYFFNQRLEFPRKMAEDVWNSQPDSTYYDLLNASQFQIEMRNNVKIACAYQAYYIAKIGGNDIHLENRSRGISSISESYGPVSESVSYTGATPSMLCTEARKILRTYKSYPRLVRG